MSHTRKNFIPRNEGFICGACGAQVPPARGTFRNHCPSCLTAKHVDDVTPGDRASACQGLMPAIDITGSDPDSLIITHTCERCGKTIRNKLAEDDDKDKAIALFS